MLRRNVLIFHLGALGDFVLTWPLAMALGRLYAQSRILYVTHGQKGALAERVLRVESVDADSGGWHELFGAAPPQLPERAMKLMSGAHSIISFVARGEGAWLNNARALAAEVQLIRLDPCPPADYRGHFTDFLVEQLGAWPAVQASVIAMLRAIQDRGIAPSARQARSERIVIHPGSGGERKCWPRERFLKLVEQLRAEGRAVRVILGEAERERWSADDVARFRAVVEVVTPATLLDLHDELAGASLALMNDSGPAHLAGVIGTPTLVLFGPSNPAIWRPLGPSVSVMHQDLESLPTATVHGKLMQLWGNPHS